MADTIRNEIEKAEEEKEIATIGFTKEEISYIWLRTTLDSNTDNPIRQAVRERIFKCLEENSLLK